ncbi:Pro-apoptotic serine protease [Smittium culicis]|uniref:Pro-apoptotic serine protease NMA111 n=1 Tax=Smittium culicis TaxID=133412 RepID=A0A1R1YMW7_9FUNG|nr:Pro-apoptotic serine protease [Smittium culicis]
MNSSITRAESQPKKSKIDSGEVEYEANSASKHNESPEATPVRMESQQVQEILRSEEIKEKEYNTEAEPSEMSSGKIESRRGSRRFSETVPTYSRRKTLAQSDLMAVFYMPNIMKQHTITEIPFESEMVDGVGVGSEMETPSWEPTLERAIKAIVSIKANCVRSFDTETSGNYTATGFVVDAKNGIILSNRHVVNPAPIVAQAFFTNYEEVELLPIYRDPVHDFGFFKFDPTKIKFMSLCEIKLAPNRAKVGMEIRVVGNDAGEKLSILSGTLARLDRNSPDYGVGEYNDFNTFYMQAASGTSGGSSGSPVLNIYGDAIALNAGGSNKASSSYYLPLNRVAKALKHIQAGEIVPRGTMQTEFEHLPYDDLRRLGLGHEIEKSMRERYPDETGMLSIKNVIPEGPAHNILHPGDILIAMNDHPLTSFIQVAEVLDDNVGNNVKLTVLRCRKAYNMYVKVGDLHLISPSKFIEIGGGVVNELSYQVARGYGLPVRGVYVASSGHMLGSANVWRGSVVLSINHKKTQNLEEFAEAVKDLTSGTRVPIRFFAIDQQHKEKVMIMNVACDWHPFRMAKLSHSTGLWEYKDLVKPKKSFDFIPQTVRYPKLGDNLKPAGELWSSIVSIDFHIPYLVDGMITTQFYGPGYIIDKENGLIVCDRDTVPISTGDVFITFAQSLVITAKIILLHPIYNFTILKYDTRLIGDTEVKNLNFEESYFSGEKKLEQGDPVVLVAIGNDHNPIVRRTLVSSRTMLSTRECAPPRWRAANIEGVNLEDQPSCQGGLLTNEKGEVLSFWVNFSTQDGKGKEMSFMAGIDPSILRPVIESYKKNSCISIRSLDLELWTVRPAAARSLGLSSKRLHEMEIASKSYSKFYYILGLLNTQSPSYKLFKAGDILLELNGELVTSIDKIAVIYDQENVNITILRDGNEMELAVQTSKLSVLETKKVIGWAGAIIQEPYRAVQEQVKKLPSKVYVTCTLFGSPASGYGLKPGVWITEIEGFKINTMSDFINRIKSLVSKKGIETDFNHSNSSMGDAIESGYVRLNVVNKIGVSKVISIKLDEHYWPSMCLAVNENKPYEWDCNFEISKF